jgi:hypothetical protein
MSQLLYPKERAFGTHWIGGWMGPRTDLDAVEKKKSLFHVSNETLYSILFMLTSNEELLLSRYEA